MTLNELIERVRTDNPTTMAKVDDRVAARVLRAALAAIAADVEGTTDGVNKVAGLGVFRIRTVAPKADGSGGGRVVTFRPVAPKVAAG